MHAGSAGSSARVYRVLRLSAKLVLEQPEEAVRLVRRALGVEPV
jgi:hypothetical protein